MREYILIIIVGFSVTSCFDSKRQPRHNVYRPEFDISNDNRSILCSFYENDKAGIYQIGITENKKQRVTPESEYSFIKPVLSPDNKQIACIAESLTDQVKGKLCLVDIATHRLTELTSDSTLILEYTFDPSGKSIYFTAAGHFGNYSPVARKAPHEINIFNVDITTKKITQITDYDAYDLHGLSITNNGDSLLFRLIDRDKTGLFWMDIKNKNLTKLSASNDLRAEKKLTPYEYYTPVLSRDNSKITFSEPYELYIMDRKTRISKLIFRNEPSLVNVGDVKFFNGYNYVLIALPTPTDRENNSGDNFGFYTLNPETNELKTLDL
jgi:Tol biopolymer transport system component